MNAYRIRDGQWYLHSSHLELYAQVLWFKQAQHCLLSFGFDIERGWGLTIALPWITYFHFAVDAPLPRLKQERKFKLAVHGGSIWWTVWRSWRDGCSSSTPKWREGSFSFIDAVLGKRAYSDVTKEERQVLVPMPEKSYEATARLFESTWKRPRWFAQRLMRVQITNDQGIPHQGKGENSYDCGTDATFGITLPAKSIPEGVGSYVGSCLADRVKYGGWDDWSWTKPA